jgi:probable phosphoglycerate mutase
MTVAPTQPPNDTEDSGRLFLLRHGDVEKTGAGRHYIGQGDRPLSGRGRVQAEAWAAYFATVKLDTIVCSDLSRCLDTARIIGAASQQTPRARPELREIALGAWEGQSFAAIQGRDPQAFQQRGRCIADHRPPGGESFRDLDRRVWPFFEERLCQPQRRTLVVTHAGVIRVLLCRLLGMPLENLFSVGVAYGALSIIALRPAGCRLQALNLPAPV